MTGRRFVLFNDVAPEVVTWDDLAVANDPEIMDVIGALEDGERAIFGIDEEVWRLDDGDLEAAILARAPL